MSDALLEGLAANPATPDDMLLRLLEAWPIRAARGLRRRGQVSASVRAVMLGHARPLVRLVAAEVRPPLADDRLYRLLTEFDAPPAEWRFTPVELFEELYASTGYDRRLVRIAAGHERPAVREFAARSWSALDEPARKALLADPVPAVRAAAEHAVEYEREIMQPEDLPARHIHAFWSVLQRPLSRALVDHVMSSGDLNAMAMMGRNPTVPPDVVAVLLEHPEAAVRHGVARRAGLSDEQLARLGDDVVPPLEDALRWARSADPLLRRWAARQPDLPAAVVAALAGDGDPAVRALIARHPRLPVEGLARFAEDPDPALRRLVAHDPNADPALVERLLDDPVAGVRAAMAGCVRLPVPRILPLLEDPELGGAAAANPALPGDALRALFERVSAAGT
ncbi:hypothetical protein [Dactylosporangium sp. CS-033363]|uniref:hypothetical protein n=1 Tax=Dactylosporangium sp. CS-033363 TaxID=3239935 RepID=UPI003D93939B